jgi:hypothetical protein
MLQKKFSLVGDCFVSGTVKMLWDQYIWNTIHITAKRIIYMWIKVNLEKKS